MPVRPDEWMMSMKGALCALQGLAAGMLPGLATLLGLLAWSVSAAAQPRLVQVQNISTVDQFCQRGIVGQLLGDRVVWDAEAEPPVQLYGVVSEYDVRVRGESERMAIAVYSYERSDIARASELERDVLNVIDGLQDARLRNRGQCAGPLFQQSYRQPVWHSHLGVVSMRIGLFTGIGYVFRPRPLLTFALLPRGAEIAPGPDAGASARRPPTGPATSSSRPETGPGRGPAGTSSGRPPDIVAPLPDTAGRSPLASGRGRDEGKPSLPPDDPTGKDPRIAKAERPGDVIRPVPRDVTRPPLAPIDPARPGATRPVPRTTMIPSAPEAAPPPPIAPKRYPPPSYDVEALDPHVSTKILTGESKAESVFAVETVECSEEGNWIVGYVGFMTTGADGADRIRIKQRFALNNYPGEGGIQLKELRTRPHVTCDAGNVECSAPRRVLPLRDIVEARKRLEATKAAGTEKDAGKVTAGGDKSGAAETGEKPGDWRCRPDLGQCFSRETDNWRCERNGRCHAIEPTRWWCVPRREFCYARVAFGDWGSTLGEDDPIQIKHGTDFVYAMKDGFVPIAKHILKNHCSGPGRKPWSASWRSAK